MTKPEQMSNDRQELWDYIETLIAEHKTMIDALEFYADDQQFSCGTVMTDGQKRDMDDYGNMARQALSKLKANLNE